MRQLPYIKAKIWPKIWLKNFYGGLNTREAPSDIADNEAQDLLNVELSDGGAISKRHGTNIVGNDKSSTADTTKGIHAAYYGNGSAKLLMATQDATTSGLYYRTTGNYTEATLNGGASKLANADVSFASFYDGTNEVVFIVDGTNFQKYKPSDNKIYAATESPASVGSIIQVYKNRLYSVGSTSNPERIYFSAIGDGDSWTAADYFDVPSQSVTQTGKTGDPIMALSVLQNRLIILKARSIWAYDGSTLRLISESHGCVGKRAIASNDYFLYFADNDGAYRLSGTSISKITKKIQPTWNTIVAGAIGGTAMAFHKGKLYVAIGTTGTTNNKILVQYTDLPPDQEGQNPWVIWDGETANPLDANHFAVYEATTTTAAILVFGKETKSATAELASSGNADYHFGGGARNESIDGYYKTKDYSLSARFKKLFVTTKAQASSINLNVDALVDFSTTINADFDMYDATDSAVVKKDNISEKGKYINYKLQTSASSAQPFTLYEMKQTYKPLKLR